MGDGYGAAFRYLLFEKRNNRAVGAEHVSEAHGDKLGVFTVLAYGLDYHFADALCGAHNVCGVYRLVG